MTGKAVKRGEEVLTPPALEFVADLHRWFGGRREIFERVALADVYVDFLTVPAAAAID